MVLPIETNLAWSSSLDWEKNGFGSTATTGLDILLFVFIGVLVVAGSKLLSTKVEIHC